MIVSIEVFVDAACKNIPDKRKRKEMKKKLLFKYRNKYGARLLDGISLSE
jgi:hypothetical protein